MIKQEQTRIINADEVANYVVCPEAWRLKYLEREGQQIDTSRAASGRKSRKEWIEKQDLSSVFRSYARIVYCLVVAVVIVVFLLEQKRTIDARKKNVRATRAITQQGDKQ